MFTGNPGYAISSRFDLESQNPGAFGGYDTKVSTIVVPTSSN